MFTGMPMLCCICGRHFEPTVRHTNYGYFHEAACSRKCLDEKKWRETLSIMGHPYSLDPRNKNMMKKQIDHTKLMVIDDLPPEDVAMLQAIYSRSAESAESHIERVKKSSGKFMSTYYVGYGHKSIADCGTTTMFIENVSLLAAKAIQDWPLYSGQETSTRYIDMSKQHIVDPIGTPESKKILDDWMDFYISNQDITSAVIKERHPMKEGEKPDVYEKAVKARTFDVLRGFLPAGITTQLSWHTNLRQAGDHLSWLTLHPASEIRDISVNLRSLLGEMYPSSGAGLSLPLVSGVDGRNQKERDDRMIWETVVSNRCTYMKGSDHLPKAINRDAVFMFCADTIHEEIQQFEQILATRPRGCVLPHFMTEFGQVSFDFLLDFGSFRDIQRHRNGVCRMPLLTTEFGFEDWYTDQLGAQTREDAYNLIDEQTKRIHAITDDAVVRQYYTALGFRVVTRVTYGLPAAVYVMELRSGKTVHPTLRRKIQGAIAQFEKEFPYITLHVDKDPDDWDVRRGTQTITER